MKKITILFTMFLAGSLLQGQSVVLTRDSHGLTENQVNEMQRSSFVEPGSGGTDCLWDLSAMEALKDLTGLVLPSALEDAEGSFPMADVVLNEDGNRFFFSNEGQKLDAWGMMNKSGRVLMLFDTPYTKMVYPFRYGDRFSGTYEGNYLSGDRKLPLTGSYEVEADGYGTLILPGGVEVENSLRVVSKRSYEVMFNTAQIHEIITYRWYHAADRFPLAVLITTHSSACGDGNTGYQAAYKIPSTPEKPFKTSSAPAGSLSVFPNPVHREFNLNYTVPEDGRVLIELFDGNGKLIASLADRHMQAGNYEEVINSDHYSMSPGVYFIRSTMGGEELTSTFLRQR